MADLDIDRFLEVEASAIQKDAEVERIMACFKLDPFDILELDVGCLDKDIKVAYRKKSYVPYGPFISALCAILDRNAMLSTHQSRPIFLG